MDEEKNKYTISGLEEYIRQGEPRMQERAEAWQVGIGLQQVDGLQASDYLLNTAKRHIEGEITIQEAKQLIDTYYKTVIYASHDTISEALDYDLRTERDFSYAGMHVDDAIRHLARFCANLWQIHAFCEGNTRTTAVFLIKYLQTLGFQVLNDVFAENSWFFRNALVRANYNNLQKGITETTVYLEHFLKNLLLGEHHTLRNRELHIDWNTMTEKDNKVQSAIQRAKMPDELSSKCKSCTLEEIAVLRIVQENPSATQKDIAAQIGKSERKVKSITIALQEKGILRRVNGKRNGHWEVRNE